ncbi:hypothetical protein Tco_1213989 [Tanacetum coccineum]
MLATLRDYIGSSNLVVHNHGDVWILIPTSQLLTSTMNHKELSFCVGLKLTWDALPHKNYGPLIWPSIEENKVTRPKKYSELSATEALQADCNIKATNIILQGLPPEVYALVSGYNFKREGAHVQIVPKPRRKRDDLWFKGKGLLVQAQEGGQILHEEDLAFLQIHEFQNVRATQTVKLTMKAYQADDFDKAQQLEPMLYVGDIIQKTNPIVIPDSKETLTLAEESPFWSHNSMNSLEPDLSDRPTNVEVPKELPKVSMVNTSLKKLKYHLVLTFDWKVQERNTPRAINKVIDIQPTLVDELGRKSKLSSIKLEQALEQTSSKTNLLVQLAIPPLGNTKKDKILQTQSSTQMNKVEAHHRKVKYSLKNKDHVVAPKGTAHVQHSKLNANSKLKCVKCNGCILSDNHDFYVLDYINNVNARAKSKFAKKQTKRKVWKPTGKMFTTIGYIWRPTGQTFTIIGNACLLTRITTTTEAPLKKPVVLDNETSKPAVKAVVLSRKPRNLKLLFLGSTSKGSSSVSANKRNPVNLGDP